VWETARPANRQNAFNGARRYSGNRRIDRSNATGFSNRIRQFVSSLLPTALPLSRRATTGTTGRPEELNPGPEIGRLERPGNVVNTSYIISVRICIGVETTETCALRGCRKRSNFLLAEQKKNNVNFIP